MSSATKVANPEVVAPQPQNPTGTKWGLWRRQLAGVVRLELRKNILSRRMLPLLLLAALPVVWMAIISVAALSEADRLRIEPNPAFAFVFRVYYLKIAIFLSCLVVFVQLFRGDILDRSLHYYLLCPVRREIFVAAKYLVGSLSSSLVMAASVAATYLVVHLSFGSAALGSLVSGLLTYAAIAILGCLGYGAVFMLMGLFFKNPVLPAIGLFILELANPFLHPLIKKVSIIHYLISLLPHHVSVGAFEILAPNTSPYLSVPSLLIVIAATVWLASWRLRQMEISYSDD